MLENIKKSDEQTVVTIQWTKPLNPAQVFRLFNDYEGERYFFSTKEKDEWLIGIGTKHLFKKDRVDPSWVNEQFKQQLAQYGSDGQHIKLFGGFQFDEGDSELFQSFGHSHFVIPKMQIHYTDGAYHITFIGQSADQIDSWTARLSNDVTSPSLPHITDVYDVEPETFMNNVAAAVEEMKAEHLEKVVLSRQKIVELDGHMDNSILIERALLGAEFSYFVVMENGEATYISKTPEQLVKVEDGQVMTNAIAGTMGKEVADAEEVLLNDDKNLREHQIVVESILQDLSLYTEAIERPSKPELLENVYFYHLYTPIKGRAAADVMTLSTALHPTPALGGYPKHEAAELIKRLEGNRGLYGAPMGYIDSAMNGEFIVAIRSMMIRGERAVLFAGCGIVSDSDPMTELNETAIKFKPMLQLLGVNE